MNDSNLLVAPGNPVLPVEINLNKNFAFIEFCSVEETTNAMAFYGLVLQGQSLKICRPKDYKPMPGLMDAVPWHIPDSISVIINDRPQKIFVGGLPTCLNHDEVKSYCHHLENCQHSTW